MKRLICAASVFAAALFAQDAKVAPVPTAPPAPATERPLSETEVLKLQLTQAKIELLQKQFDIDNYQKQLKPISDEQQAVFMAACESVGIAKEKIADECRLQTGLDQKGQPVIGPDGKPVQAKVWREVLKTDSTSGGKAK